MIGLLQAGSGHNADSLACECGVTRRTVFRDLKTLQESGVPIEFDELRQRYCIPTAYYLPPTNFTPEEALSLIVLCNELGERRGLPFLSPARKAAMKLEGSLSPQLRKLLQAVGGTVKIRPARTSSRAEQQPVFDQLVEALANRRSVRIQYDSFAERKTIITRLNPYRLLFSRRSWYVIGRSSLHRATRTFNLNRVLDLKSLDEHYEFPRGFSIDRYLGNAWHLIPEPGPDFQIVVRFRPMVAQNVAEVGWHKTQRVVQNDDGTIDFHATVSGLSEISWWILGYGDQAEVLKPAQLRRIIADRATRMARIYEKR